MFYKLVGAVSLIVGAVFALLALIVLLAFLGNMSWSLLLLLGVLVVLTWVFLLIGWQILHPPKKTVVETPAVAAADEIVAVSPTDASTPEGLAAGPLDPVAEARDVVTAGGFLIDEVPAPLDPALQNIALHHTSFEGFGETHLREEALVESPGASLAEADLSEAEAHAETHNLASRYTAFRKPGAPVPRASEDS